MNRLHVNVSVKDIGESVDYYTTLFATRPSVLKDDYAKWMLDDPCVNFSISLNARKLGVNHLGIQTDSPEGLAAISARLQAAQAPMVQEQAAQCCYAVSDKTWAQDPQGVSWETFYTHGAITDYGDDVSAQSRLRAAVGEVGEVAPSKSEDACCTVPADAVE